VLVFGDGFGGHEARETEGGVGWKVDFVFTFMLMFVADYVMGSS